VKLSFSLSLFVYRFAECEGLRFAIAPQPVEEAERSREEEKRVKLKRKK
jgi:hypothetical protein